MDSRKRKSETLLIKLGDFEKNEKGDRKSRQSDKWVLMSFLQVK